MRLEIANHRTRGPNRNVARTTTRETRKSIIYFSSSSSSSYSHRETVTKRNSKVRRELSLSLSLRYLERAFFARAYFLCDAHVRERETRLCEKKKEFTKKCEKNVVWCVVGERTKRNEEEHFSKKLGKISVLLLSRTRARLE